MGAVECSRSIRPRNRMSDRSIRILTLALLAALGLYCAATVFYALSNQIYGTLPFLMLFQVGFLYTGLLSIFQQFTDEDIIQEPEIAK